VAVDVRVLPADAEKSWDDFVERCEEATFFHRAGWRRVITEAFGHTTYYLQAMRDGVVTGVLPLTQVKSRLFGNTLISNAFCMEGGIAASDPESADALRLKCEEIGRELNVDCVEFRAGQNLPGWTRREGLYVSFKRGIVADNEANMKAIPRKQRAMVRKAMGFDLTSTLDADAGRLHHVYAQSVHHLGTPVFPRRYFELLKKEFGADCDIVTIEHKGEAVASVMNFYFRDTVNPYYGGGTSDARQLAANDFMYWEVMRRAADRGYRVFDFGRSKLDTGAYAFKKNWGFEPQPLAYEFLPVAKSEIPEKNPLNPKYQAMIAAWRRMPLWATKIVGPMIVRSIG
jgi:FemAB-related protein (PEP-CTERM system-associated)